VNEIDRYADAVASGAIASGVYHRLSCDRHIRDRARERSPEFPYYFDLAQAERFFLFASKLKHYKGEWAGQSIDLQPFQRFRLGSIFGWRHVDTGRRRFRTAYNEIPRKNGKSLEAAIVALYVTFFDGEAGAEGYCVATKREQARVVFDDAKQLVKASGLRHRIAGSEHKHGNLYREDTASKLQPLGADSDGTDGLNPSLLINDEFHAQKDRGLLDVLETATGARAEPLNFQITTAGSDMVTPCGDQHDYACKILKGVLADETFFAFIAHADDGDDWLDESTWRKANPNYGVSVKPDDLRALATKAAHMPAAAAAFKQKRLNCWVNAAAPWLSLDGWARGQSAPSGWTLDDLKHTPCYVGIDLASKLDLCALVALFPPTKTCDRWRVVPSIWTPGDGVVDRARRDRAPYDLWTASGALLTTPGPRIDHAVIRPALVALRARFDVETIGFDPWHADKLIDELVTLDGFAPEQVVAVPQTYAGMSHAAQLFEAEVVDGKVDARGHPVMAWAASNAVVQRDGKDNIYPVKKLSRGRIDPIVATIIARALAAKAAASAPPQYQLFVFGGGSR